MRPAAIWPGKAFLMAAAPPTPVRTVAGPPDQRPWNCRSPSCARCRPCSGSAEGALHHHQRPATGRGGCFEDRIALAHAARIDPDRLTDLARQADLARVKGVGWVFGLMLEALGIGDIAILARQQPGRLHEQLRRYNQTHRLSRRAPTAEEVASWIDQARQLPELVTYPPQQREARR